MGGNEPWPLQNGASNGLCLLPTLRPRYLTQPETQLLVCGPVSEAKGGEGMGCEELKNIINV